MLVGMTLQYTLLSRTASCTLVAGLLVSTTAFAQDEPRWLTLGDLPGGDFVSSAHAVSADGKTVVGKSEVSFNVLGYEAFIWTEATGMFGLGDVPDGIHYSYATAVAPDGSAVAGFGSSVLNGRYEGTYWYWTEATGLVGIGWLDGFQTPIRGIAPDAAMLVGRVTYGPTEYEAITYRPGEGFTKLGILPGAQTSDAKRILDGTQDIRGGGVNSGAFAWDSDDGMTPWPLDGTDIPTGDISADGTASCGGGTLWTENHGFIEIPDLPGGLDSNSAKAVSNNGRVVVGWANIDLDHPINWEVAFVWDAKRGARWLADDLATKGIDTYQWHPTDAFDITPNGRIVVGQTRTGPNGPEAYLADLGPECEADYTGDYRVATDDIIKFLNMWNAGDWGGDFDWNGTIDAADVTGFLQAYVNGCP